MTNNQYLTLKDLANSLKRLDQDTLVRCRKLIEDIYFILDRDVTDESYSDLCKKYPTIEIKPEPNMNTTWATCPTTICPPPL